MKQHQQRKPREEWRSSGSNRRPPSQQQRIETLPQRPIINQQQNALLTAFQTDYLTDWDWKDTKNWDIWLQSPNRNIL